MSKTNYMKILKELMKKKINIFFIVPCSLECESWILCSFQKAHLNISEISYFLNLSGGSTYCLVFMFLFFLKNFLCFLSFMSNDSLLIWKEYVAGYMAAFLDSIY